MSPLNLFETPVFVHQTPERAEADRALAAELTAESLSHPGVQVSNRGGWHSIPDLARRPDPAFRSLCERLAAAARTATDALVERSGRPPLTGYGISLTAWAMVMRDGDYTVLHDHPDATWSLAYTLDPGDADLQRFPDSGNLTLVDPRRGMPSVLGLNLFPSAFHIRPRQGTLTVFPGTVQHHVAPYRGTRPRVVVAANAVVRG
jgi:hypothetical protein